MVRQSSASCHGSSPRRCSWSSSNSTIVNTAVPSMAASLHVIPLSLKAVAARYILSLAVCIPVSGWTADRYGTRRVFALAIVVFTISYGVLRARHERAADGGGAYFTRDRRGHDDAGWATHRDPHLSQGGTAASNEFRHHSRADRAVAWPDGRLVVVMATPRAHSM